MLLSGYNGGRTRGSVPAVLFLWQNWQHFFTIAPVFAVEATGPFSWKGSGHGWAGTLRAEWFITQYNCRSDHGVIHAHSYALEPLPFSHGETLWIYRLLANGELMYVGGGYGELPAGLKLVSPILRRYFGRMARLMAINGGRVSREITERPELVLEKCGEEAYELYLDYVREHKNMGGAAGAAQARYFRSAAIKPISLYSKTQEQTLGSALSEMKANEQLANAKSADADGSVGLELALECARIGVPRAGLVALGEWADHMIGNWPNRGGIEQLVAFGTEVRKATDRSSWQYSSADQMLTEEIELFAKLYTKACSVLTS